MLEPTQPAPPSLVDEAGQVRFGVFDQPLHRIGLDQATLKVGGVRMPRAWTRFRYKEWQHYAFILPDLFVGMAVVDTKFLATTWCHVVDRLGGPRFEHHRQRPGLDLRIAEQLWNDETHLHMAGYAVDIQNRLDEGEHRVRIRIEADRGRPAVSAELVVLHDLTRDQPLVVCLPVGPNRGMYSHKVALPLEGSIRVGEKEHAAEAERCFAILDIHKALYPHRTWWRWATWAGRTDEGQTVAGNLTKNVNIRDDKWNENGLWLDGALERLGPASFSFDEQNVLAPWRLKSADGAVDLTFHPQGERTENVNLGLVKSAFHQPWGRFEGTVRFGGREHTVRDAFGVCEDHVARW